MQIKGYFHVAKGLGKEVKVIIHLVRAVFKKQIKKRKEKGPLTLLKSFVMFSRTGISD